METKHKNLLKKIYYLALYPVSCFFLIIALIYAILIRFTSSPIKSAPKLVWGSTPIINYAYWSKAMAKGGFTSETFTNGFFTTINKRSDWDRVISEEFLWLWWPLRPYLAFLSGLKNYDIFFLSFDGFFLGDTPFKFFQAQILKLARKKIVILSYGGDSYVYKNIRDTGLLHALLISYPQFGKQQHRISANVNYWVKHADVLIPGFMGPDGFGRWDVLIPSPFMIDLDQWKVSKRKTANNGSNGKVVVVHATNHRGFKGSEFVIETVKKLKKEGLKVELRLLEKIQNTEVKRILNEEADILVENLIYTGYAVTGIEGLASGLPTIANLENQDYIKPLRRWSYFEECPIVSGSPETLEDVLRRLITSPHLRRKLGKAGREYAEKYHGLDSAQYLFTNVVDFLYGEKQSLINLYHPLLGEYPNRSAKVIHPLVNSQIPG